MPQELRATTWAHGGKSPGFSLDGLELKQAVGSIGAGESGPGLHQDAQYALIVAVRD